MQINKEVDMKTHDNEIDQIKEKSAEFINGIAAECGISEGAVKKVISEAWPFAAVTRLSDISSDLSVLTGVEEKHVKTILTEFWNANLNQLLDNKFPSNLLNLQNAMKDMVG